jgi:hypothetical protein
MSLDDVVDFGIGLGEVVADIGQDIVLGLERSAQGLGAGEDGRQAQIGAENERAARLIKEVFTTAPGAATHPVTRLITEILIRYYDALPDEMIDALAKKARIVIGAAIARQLVKRQVKAVLVRMIAPRIAAAIATSAIYRGIAARLGVSAAATVSGVGTLLGLVLMQGLLQRASEASQRLRNVAPDLHQALQRDGLDMIYFLAEKPMERHIEAIVTARTNGQALRRAAQRVIERSQ